MIPELTEEDRRKLLNRRNGALAEYERLMNGLASTPPFSADESRELTHARAAMARAEAAETEYFEALPIIPVTVCPFCSKPVLRSFDLWGFDGPWWRSDATPQDPPDCPHFYALLGAVQLSGAERPAREIYTGPEKPFVVPRLLSFPTSLAVVGQLQMKNSCAVWPIAYFAERRPRPEDSTAGWRRTNFVYTTQFSVSGWRIPSDPLDFDLAAWFGRGKVRYCDPASDNTALTDGMYVCDTAGVTEVSVLTPSGIVRYAAPTGNPVWPVSG